MNFIVTRKMLTFAFILFIFSSLISSVFSNKDESSNQMRYLDDEAETPNKIDCNITDACDMGHIKCDIQETHQNCSCEDGYYPNEFVEGLKYCSIEQKKQLTAFLLELFVGFGAGHFYRHEYLMASLKLVAFFIGIYLICLFPLTAKCVTDCCDSDCCVIIISIFFYLYALGLAFWYIWDLVYFGKNKYKDYSHGDHKVPLKPW